MSCYISSLAKRLTAITARWAGKDSIRKMNDMKTSTAELANALPPATYRRALLETRQSILKKLAVRLGSENCFRHLK
jgi:hypothetical protein